MKYSWAHDMLLIIREAAAERYYELHQHSPSRLHHSDDETDVESPIFDSFYNFGGNESLQKMTNFTGPRFRNI